MSQRLNILIVGLIGLTLVGLVAASLGLPVEDSMQLVAISGGAALVTGLLGAGLLFGLRGHSFTAQVSVVALTSSAAVVAGAVAAGNAMFLSDHDLRALIVVVAVGAVVGVVTGLLLGQQVGAASRTLGIAAQKITDPTVSLQGRTPTIREFAALADELQRTAAELEASRERERATEQARRDLVSWVSHDLRTPLAGIRAICELLEDDIVDDPDEIMGYYATLRRESDKLAALVDDLFEVSKINAGSLHLEFEPVNLGDLVSDTLAAVSPVAGKRGIRVYGRVTDPTAQIDASPPELARILRNLVTNAVRESRDGGAVLVEAGVTTIGGERQGFLAVQDTCGGIPEDVLPRVFEAAYRGSSARTPRDDGGAGLGLAIVHGLVEAHGGDISVGNVAEGCRFFVRLPATHLPTTVAGAPGPAAADDPTPTAPGQVVDTTS